MNEVEKMYENAGIEQLPTCNNCYMLVEYWSNGTYCSTCKDDKDNDECGIADYNYPPFTAEKQLELIKFLFNHNVYYDVDTKGNYWFYISDDCYTYYYNKFEIALANIINEMWQDLTDAEKQQVKGILE